MMKRFDQGDLEFTTILVFLTVTVFSIFYCYTPIPIP